MNMRYFIVTSAAFASVCAFSSASVAQGANRVAASYEALANKQVSNFSDKAASKQFGSIFDNSRKEVAKLVAVSWPPKKRSPKFWSGKRRPNPFSRGPMSFK
ncbi:hypothetical protein [Bartonella taylorii]|uniref:hypothetical protein n=1 Tax=Bartonella taylorii TaxID=33046 RepID=UPI001ABA8ABD|nr:hypothetical protein [Bartonella taylorii]